MISRFPIGAVDAFRRLFYRIAAPVQSLSVDTAGSSSESTGLGGFFLE